MKKITFLATAMLFILTSTSLFAQNTYNGTWKFNGQESISGNLYANGSPKQVTINQTGDTFDFESITTNQAGDAKTSESLTIGKPVEAKTPMDRKKVSTIQWSADSKSLIETTNIYSKTDAGKLDFKYTDTWTFESGKLILDRKNENYTNGETWESKATYEKQ
ncbi:MAG TPA: hypothetical protein VGM63_00765 [Mucilaginibacter sp.]|jgi:hypothetical protein